MGFSFLPAASGIRLLRRLCVMVTTLMLVACDLDTLISGNMPQADAQATGAACRHALRGVEECYRLNPSAGRAAVYTGWKDMDQYMRENKLEGMVPAVAAATGKTRDP